MMKKPDQRVLWLSVFVSLASLYLLPARSDTELSTGANTPAPLRLLEHEALDQDADAQLLYGLAYLEGRDGLKPDAEKAVYWLRRSARMGNAYAQFALGKAYANGQGVKRDLPHAVKWWRESAGNGNMQAQYRFGKALLYGQGIEKNTEQAIDWLTKSAGQNNVDAQILLGKMHAEGYAVTQDKAVARDWLSRAALLGSQDAISLLAVLKNITHFTTQVYHESADVLIKRAEAGDPQAEYELGIRYESGAWDVKQDKASALKWIRKAAEHENVIAMQTLANIYLHGELGVPSNWQQAAYWKQRAATSPE